MTDAQTIPKSKKTITVGCKLPNGIVLHLDEMVDDYEPVMGGGSRKIKVAKRLPMTVTLNGAAVPVGTPLPKHQISYGAGLTHGVDAEFFDKWLEANKEAPFVKNKLVFAATGRDSAEDQAKELEAVKTGLEPLDPSFTVGKDGKSKPNDYRIPRSINTNVSVLPEADRPSA